MQQFSDSPESQGSPLLTLKEIADGLQVEYGRLRGFAESEGVRSYVGARDVEGVKGVRIASFIDAICIANRLNRGEPVGPWQWF